MESLQTESSGKSKKDKGACPLHVTLPHYFLAPNKSNLFKLRDEGLPDRLDFDPIQRVYMTIRGKGDVLTPEQPANPAAVPISEQADGGEAVEPPESTDQVALFIMNRNVRICQFLYGVNWFSCWIVKNAAPHLDDRSSEFTESRQYVANVFRTVKNTFLWAKLLPHVEDCVQDWASMPDTFQLQEMDMDNENNKRWVV